MPQGKGTYGSQVGRPPKKYQDGGTTDQNEAVLDAAMKGQELKSISLESIPTENAPDRKQVSLMGDEVGTGMYEEGGFIKKAVEKYKSKKAGKKREKVRKKEGKEREKARKKAVEEFPITGIVQPKKKGLKPAIVPSDPPLFKGDTVKEKFLNQSILYGMGKKAGKKGKK